MLFRSVIPNPVLLEAMGVTVEDILKSLVGYNSILKSGKINNDNNQYSVVINSSFKNLQNILSIPLIKKKDKIITYEEVVEIKRTYKDGGSITKYKQKPVILVNVVKRIGANILNVTDDIKNIIKTHNKNNKDNIKLEVILDKSSQTESIIFSLENSVTTAIIIVMLVILLFVGIKSSILIFIAIPTSFLLTFIIANFYGFTLNVMVMFGLVLSVGLLVDSTIVIVEYADRKIKEGIHYTKAYIAAAKRMMLPISSSLLTTIVAFSPLLFWPGISGKFMYNLPITVIIILSSSFITSIVFVPFLGRFIKIKDSLSTKNNTSIEYNSKSFDHRKIRGILGKYLEFIYSLIHNPVKTIVACALVCVCVITLFIKASPGTKFFVDAEAEQFYVFVRAKGNYSDKQKQNLTEKVDKRLADIEGVDSSYYVIGESSGIGQNFGSEKPQDVIGEILIKLKPYGKRKPSIEIVNEARERIKNITGVMTDIAEIKGGPPVGKDIKLEIIGDNYQEVLETTRAAYSFIDSELKSIDLEDETPLPFIEWNIQLDKEEAARYNINPLLLSQFVQITTNGFLLDKYRPSNSDDEIDIKLIYPKEYRKISNINNIQIITEDGKIPFTSFARIEPRKKKDVIIRRNGKYSMFVKANLVETVKLEEQMNILDSWLKSNLPSSVQYIFRGSDEEGEKSATFLKTAMLASIFAIFMILVVQFNSFYQSFLTLISIIFAQFGVLLGIVVTGQEFIIILTGTGIIALNGVVVNNAIVFFDSYNHIKKHTSLTTKEAILLTTTQRIRPILLTTITSILGLLPMATGISLDIFSQKISYGSLTSNWWVPFATAFISGLSFSSVIILLLIPCLLMIPENLKLYFKNKKMKIRMKASKNLLQ